MKRFPLVIAFLLFAATFTQGQTQKTVPVYVTADCSDAVGTSAVSAFRERIRGSNGYILLSEPTAGRSGWEVLVTCAEIPLLDKGASAVSYVFDMFLPDGARYFY